MTTQYGEGADTRDAPTKIITQRRRLRALLPPMPPERVEDIEATIALTFGPETISTRRLGLQASTGRSPIPLNSGAYATVDREVAAYQNGYSDGFVDSIVLRRAYP